MMPNPILSEMIARERFKDYHREIEQIQLAEAVIAHQRAHRIDLSAAVSNLLIAIRQLFKALAHAK